MAASYEGEYQGEKAIWLKAGSYEAAVLPERGGNLVAFRDAERGFRFVREPKTEEMDTFRQRPMVHGIPVLFPPNRYEDGKFPWNGRTYELPVNELPRNNHLHGFFFNIPWQVDDFGADGDTAYVVVAQRVTESHEAYAHFPHRFTIKIRYSLSERGLTQEVGVRNDGSEPMPCSIGFHTSLNAPFAPGSSAADCVARLTIGERVAMNERMLPTGELAPLNEEEKRFAGEGITPYFAQLDHHYTAVPQDGSNRMELLDTRLNVKLVYDAGAAYRFWMVYNADAASGFFCPEPQSGMVNAPNAPFSAEEIGLVSLAAGEVWQETSRFFIE